MNKIPLSLREYKEFPGDSDSEKELSKKLKLSKDDHEIAKLLKKENKLDVDALTSGIRIKAKQYVGIAPFSQFTVMVMPKIELNLKEQPENLAYFIGYAHGFEKDLIKVLPKIPEAEFEATRLSRILIELIIMAFVDKCEVLFRQGLVKSYVTHTENVRFLRGKLLMQLQYRNDLRKNLQFACEFDELEHDNLENRIILKTLEVCYLISQDDKIKQNIRRLRHQISGFVSSVPIEMIDFDKISYNRLNEHYRLIHKICKLIINNSGIKDISKFKTPNIVSFFVNMNDVFQDFVSRFLEETLSKIGYRVSTEQRKRVWYSKGRSRGARTDILIRKNSQLYILDTKYKDDIEAGDLAQIGLYTHEYKKDYGIAILPTWVGYKDEEWISPVQEKSVYVKRLNIAEIITLIRNNDYESLKSNALYCIGENDT